MVKLTSQAPINIECTRSINDEQSRLIKKYAKRIKAFEKDYHVHIIVAKNEMGTLTLKIGEAVDSVSIVDNVENVCTEMEKKMDELIMFIDRLAEEEPHEETPKDACDESKPEHKERKQCAYINITFYEDGAEIEGNANPLMVIDTLFRAYSKHLFEDEKTEEDPE